MSVLIRNVTRGVLFGTAIADADSFGSRLLGLMFRKRLAPGSGLLIQPCQAVHSHFMRFPIDVLFVDRQWRVVHVLPAMRPWRQSPFVRTAHAVLELPAGAAGDTVIGDQLEVER